MENLSRVMQMFSCGRIWAGGEWVPAGASRGLRWSKWKCAGCCVVEWDGDVCGKLFQVDHVGTLNKFLESLIHGLLT